MSAVLQFEHATFCYEGASTPSIEDITLEVVEGQFIVFTGESGCGKTTLTRFANGLIPSFFPGYLEGRVMVGGVDIAQADAGEIGQHTASIFQDPRSQFFTTDTASEVAFACENYGMPRDEIMQRIESAFSDMGIEALLGRRVFHLSSGERQKIAFAAATALNPRMYVLDEPSANLDIETMLHIRKRLAALKARGCTVLIAEHRLFWLQGLVDRYIRLSRGRVVETMTGDEFERLSDGECERRGLRPSTPPWQAAKSGIELASGKEGKASRLLALEVRHLSFSYPGGGFSLEDVSFDVFSGEVLALVGKNGCGKTTLGKLLVGLTRAKGRPFKLDGKKVRKGSLADAGFFVLQEAGHQLYTDSVETELRLGRDRQSSGDAVSSTLAALNLSDMADAHPQSLSGGQKQRLVMGAALVSGKPLVVLDEPTSGLDWANMTAVARVVRGLRSKGCAVVVITHDYEFMAQVADRVLLLADGGVAGELCVKEPHDLEPAAEFVLGKEGINAWPC